MMNAAAAESSCTKSSTAGFARLPNALIDRGTLNALRPVALRVMLLMLRLADADGTCWPSQRAIASRIGTSVRSVQSAIRQLRICGLVSIERRGCSGQATLYRLHADGPAEPAPDAAPVAANDSQTRGHGRKPLRIKANTASCPGRTPLRTTHTQDSDTTLTPGGASTLAAADVCAEIGDGAQATTRHEDDSSQGDDGAARSEVARDIDVPVEGEAPSPPDRAQRLLALGIDESMACRLLSTHVPSRIDCALDNATFLAAHDRLGNAAGYVIAALRHNYGPLPERLDHERQQARLKRRRDAAGRSQREAAAKSQREHDQAERDADDALRFVAQLDPIARVKAMRDALAVQPSSVRAALADRDPLVSRNLAMLVRAHVQSARQPEVAAAAACSR